MKTSGSSLAALLLVLMPEAKAQFTFTTNYGSITITAYSGPGGAVTIPGTITGRPVTTIGSWAFYAAPVTSVIIPDSVTTISDEAFFDCGFLTNVVVGFSVRSIGSWAFAFCTNLANICFRGDAPALADLDVFYANGATVYYLPGMTGWGPVFEGHDAILWNPPVPYFYTITNSTITITGYLGSEECPVIPQTICFLPVTAIGSSAFYHTSVTNIAIPNNITSIGNAAFMYCSSLASVTLGSGVSNIGLYAFDYCGNLTGITVDALDPKYSSLDGILFDKKRTSLLRCPEGRTGTYAIPNSVTNLGFGAFQSCAGLTDITITDSVTSLGVAAFDGCVSLTNITIGTNVVDIGTDAFSFCDSLTRVSIPNSVANLGNGAFVSCANLAEVTLGNRITNIGSLAFGFCESISNIWVPDSVLTLGRETFQGCSGLVSIRLGSNLTNIGESVFDNCRNLAAASIPDLVAEIPRNAFDWCVSLTNVTIGNSVRNIGDSAFHWCTSLASITIPNSVANIGSAAFYNCTNLSRLVVGRGVMSISTLAFYNCCALTSITLPDRLTTMGNEVFHLCTSLTNISLGTSVTNIGDHAFSTCSNLTSITLPRSVTWIGDDAFEFCTSLKGVYFQGDAPGVALWSFAFLVDPVVYYLPGTSGWGPALDLARTVLWNPLIQADASFGVRDGAFGFNIGGTADVPLVVEASSSIVAPSWIPLQRCTLTNGAIYFADTQWTNLPTRVYRIRSP